MNFKEYQDQAAYFRKPTADYIYAVLGLCEEAGEVAGKYAKWRRDETDSVKFRWDVAKEIGDVLWMCAAISKDINIPLEDIASMNIEKLSSRLNRNVIEGSGDDR